MEQTNILSACRENLGAVQETASVQIDLTNGQIGKILCLNSSAKLDSLNPLQGEATLTGTIYTNLVYLNEIGELKHIIHQTPFSASLTSEKISPLSALLGKVEVLESVIDLVTEATVRANVTVEVYLNQIAQNEVQNFDAPNDSVKTKTEKVMLTHLKTSNAAKFNVLSEQSLKVNATEVFVTGINTCVKSVTAGTGYFTVNGEVCINFATQSQDEDKPIKCFSETLSFKEEIENEQITKNDLVLAYVSPVQEQTVLELANDENRVNFGLTIVLEANYVVLSNMEHEVVTDAFSTTCQTELISGNLCNGVILPTKYTTERIDTSVTISETEPRISKIVCALPSNLTLTKTFVNGSNIVVEGLANVCVTYETDDDEMVLSSVQAETPFSITLKNVAQNSDNIFVTANICGVNAKAKKGKEIDLDLDLCFGVDNYYNNNLPIITGVNVGECFPKSEYALKVYIAPQGSTLWDLSKKLNVSEEELVKQNPGITFPLEKPTSIVYFAGREE